MQRELAEAFHQDSTSKSPIATEGRSMPPLTDPERFQWYLNALENWNVDGYVTFEEQALRWLRDQLPTYFPTRKLAELLYLHVKTHGSSCIDEQPETRENWRDLHEYHHDLRVHIGARLVYFETRLILLRKNKDSIVTVVNAHDP
jgi:hypothetical protein